MWRFHSAAARNSITGLYGLQLFPTIGRRKKSGGPPFAEPHRPPKWGEGLGTPPAEGSNSGTLPEREERRPCESWHKPRRQRERVIKPLASLGVARSAFTLSTGGGRRRRGVGAPLITQWSLLSQPTPARGKEPAGREREGEKETCVGDAILPLSTRFRHSTVSARQWRTPSRLGSS